MADDATPINETKRTSFSRLQPIIGALIALSGLLWTLYAWQMQAPVVPLTLPSPTGSLNSGSVLSMDHPQVQYSNGWSVSESGADPSEPTDPWTEPSGIITFTYTGEDLALKLGVGDYWGYVYVTVDGMPANRMPQLRGNPNSIGVDAGYRTFYAPEKAQNGSTVAEWMTIHRSRTSSDEHIARVEVWRSWGQTPIRGIAIDALPKQSSAIWPGIALLLAGLALSYASVAGAFVRLKERSAFGIIPGGFAWALLPRLDEKWRLILALGFMLIAAIGIGTGAWVPSILGAAGLAVISIARPALWTAAIVYSLPFYYSYTFPILPERSLGLIETLVLLGILVVLANWLLTASAKQRIGSNVQATRVTALALTTIIGWALISAFASDNLDVALYEWRTVFLSAGLFAIVLTRSLQNSRHPNVDIWLIISAWIGGAVTVAIIGLAQYSLGFSLIQAEGVERIRGLYGSPNNLALYLERTFIVTLALAVFLSNLRSRIIWGIAAAIQALALVLTFSKGSLLLGVPAGLLVLWLGALTLLPLQSRSRRPLIWLAGAAVVIMLLILPFATTERFSRLLDLTEGTGYLRLLLWRSSWSMAKDYPLLGVGPDNFLYVYRSFYILPEAWQEPNLNHPHNWALDWWTRIGLPGLAIAILFFFVGLYNQWRKALRIAHTSVAESVLILGFVAAALAALTHGLIDASFALPDLMLVWVLLLMAEVRTPGAYSRSSNDARHR